MTLKENWEKYSKIHVWWIIGCLITVIIFLLAFKTENQSEVKDIINTSLALASLLLAFVAIIQVILAGGEMSRIVSEIRASASEIKEPAGKILVASEALRANSERVSTTTSELSLRLDQINIAKTEPMKDTASYEFRDVNYMTKGGWVAMHICFLSFTQNKAFNVDDILDKDDAVWNYISGYVTGFISSLKSGGSMGIIATIDNFQVNDLKAFSDTASSARASLEEEFQKYIDAADKYFEGQAETA